MARLLLLNHYRFMKNSVDLSVDAALPRESTLAVRDPENLVMVENIGGRVIIRAARNNLSIRRKLYLIRYLAAEGYIPARFERICERRPNGLSAIKWMIDPTCFKPAPTPRQQTNRFMARLIIGAFVLWLALIVLAFLNAA